MSVHTTAFDAVFGSDPLGRFTAAIVSAVPQFDPDDTPIGHALATEFFRVPQALGDEQVEPAPAASAEVPAEALEGRTEQPVEPTSPAEQTEPTDAFPVVLAPERVYEWVDGGQVRRPSPRPRPRPRVAPQAPAPVEEPLEPNEERPATVVELPVAGPVTWFDNATGQQRARRAS
ncbi:hypothetical protein SAMN05443637_106177 [Pseudonocardia thermophila]|jgi:hypothetical protein|uniref:Uncharacterized protein n=1 Tax=Pseudonocardia thermophila TaxID=1848 RepID=A0A1M6SJH1_PSETH|nr:hypothetical protein [Pseudonocardia thermophila]SHK44728.1 hypothetical protein SAMN05443637_106177 [Pseudonocardia thermophila]